MTSKGSAERPKVIKAWEAYVFNIMGENLEKNLEEARPTLEKIQKEFKDIEEKRLRNYDLPRNKR